MDRGDTVPEAWKAAAEEIRAHLVALRGGAPFLSSADARLLLEWLEQGVAVPDILRAVERMADSRRKLRSRLPLTLTGARRHLGRPTRGAVHDRPRDPDRPLDPVVAALRAQAERDPSGAALRVAADRLQALRTTDREQLACEAIAVARDFLRAAWEGLDPADRDARLRAGRAAYAGDLDGPELEAAAETAARDGLRAAYPLLTAATFWDLIYA